MEDTAVLTHPKFSGYLARQYTKQRGPIETTSVVITMSDWAAAFVVDTVAKRVIFEDLYCPGAAIDIYRKDSAVVPWVIYFKSGEVSTFFLSAESSETLKTFVGADSNGVVLEASDFAKVDTDIGTEFIPVFGTQLVVCTSSKILHFNSSYYSYEYKCEIIPNVTNVHEVLTRFTSDGVGVLKLNNGDIFVFTVQPTDWSYDLKTLSFNICSYGFDIDVRRITQPSLRETFLAWLSSAETVVVDTETTERRQAFEIAITKSQTAQQICVINGEIRSSVAHAEFPDELKIKQMATKLAISPDQTLSSLVSDADLDGLRD